MENKKIYIVLTRTNTILSRMIGFIKDDEYTHASISLDRHLSKMYSFGRKYTYNPFVGFLCSEFVYYILNKSSIANFNKSGNLVRPQELLNIKGRVVFSGNLKNTNWSGKACSESELIPRYQYAEI